jgi:hypothetical protein
MSKRLLIHTQCLDRFFLAPPLDMELLWWESHLGSYFYLKWWILRRIMMGLAIFNGLQWVYSKLRSVAGKIYMEKGIIQKKVACIDMT